MLPLRKILCPTDFSEPSFEALKVVNELAVHFSAEIYLVYVVAPIPRLSGSPPAFWNQLQLVATRAKPRFWVPSSHLPAN